MMHQSHKVEEERTSQRLPDYLIGVFSAIPTKAAIKKAIKRQEIFVDGRAVGTAHWVSKDEVIDYRPAEPITKKVFELNLKVVYEDDYLAVVNKPPGIGTSGNYFRTLENALPYNLKISKQEDALPQPLPVHRLDRDTSGLVLVAKTAASRRLLHEQFEKRQIKKTYSALVLGKIQNAGIINASIDRKEAVTRFEPVDKFEVKGQPLTLLKCFPETGRTHQIRIHLSQAGHPVLGDALYEGKTDNLNEKGLYLAAVELQFNHPVTKELITIDIPLPSKFQQIMNMYKPGRIGGSKA